MCATNGWSPLAALAITLATIAGGCAGDGQKSDGNALSDSETTGDTGSDVGPGPDSDSSSDSDMANDADADSDSDGDADSDTEITIEVFFDDLDCAGRGGEPEKCDYEICRYDATYVKQVEDCVVMTEACEIYLDCYDELFDCLDEACPPGTDVPEDKSDIYRCTGTEFDDCTMAAW